MRLRQRICSLVIVTLLFVPLSPALASFGFSDDRFVGSFTTENLDAIIEEYELMDGWYWTTRANVVQTFHGVQDCPGQTDTAVNGNNRAGYRPGWYGCRWAINNNKVQYTRPFSGGYGECFGFAQFIGYLLSGDVNPHGDWDFYYSMDSAGGLRVGDIIRVEYRANKKKYHHSAVVYAVNGEEILFLQVSSTNYNRISVGHGFSDGNLVNETSIEVISRIPSLKIMRSPLNQP